MNKYTIKDLEKALDYLKKNCQAVYVLMKFDDMNRLIMTQSDLAGNNIQINIYDEATAKMPDVTRTERL